MLGSLAQLDFLSSEQELVWDVCDFILADENLPSFFLSQSLFPETVQWWKIQIFLAVFWAACFKVLKKKISCATKYSYQFLLETSCGIHAINHPRKWDFFL